jgi:tetratricopeptide (TPR) repeat protein
VFCQGYIDSQQWNEAMAACDKALQLTPNSKGALYSRANALWKLERREEALEGFKKILAIDPIHQNALLASALVTSELNQKDEALKYFKEYLALDPGNTQVRLQIALDAAKAGNNEAALAIVEEGMKGDTSDAQLIEYAGAFAMNAANGQLAGGGDPSPEAIALMNKALGYYEKVFQAKGAQTDPTIVRNMLLAYRTLDRTDEALAFGARAVAATPNDAGLWSAYADALGKAGKTTEALAALDKAVAADPEYAVNARRGLWLLSAGKLAEAKAALSRAVEKGELDPAQVDQVAKQIAATGFNDRDKKGQHQQAIEFYEAARDLAKTPETKGMISFFHGYAIYQIAADRAKTQTVDAAKATLPMFERVVDFMQAAVPFTSSA